jgi:hypothetical protein
MDMGRVLRVVLAAAIALIGMVLYPAAHAADLVAEYGHWDMSGKTGTVTVPGGMFPVGDVTTDSTRVGTPSGASSYLNESTPFGAEFGSSRNKIYLQFGAVSSTKPSTTTIAFRTPTPARDWGFALGDIDAEKVKVEATGADGRKLTTAELGFKDAFNYCESTPRPSSCSRGPFTDKPVWDTAADTLVGRGPDTDGASGWFMPTKPVKSLTLVYSVLTGIPVAQLWLAAKVEKEAPVQVVIRDDHPYDEPGDTVDFNIEITNPNPEPAPPLIIRDDLKPVLEDAINDDNAHDDGGKIVEDGREVVWEGTVPGNGHRDVDYSVKIKDKVTGNGTFRNTVYTQGPPTNCSDGKGKGCSVIIHVAVAYPCRAAVGAVHTAVARYAC